MIFRKHLARYLKGIPHSRAWRVELLNISDADLFRERLAAFEQAWRDHLPEDFEADSVVPGTGSL